ncbi:BamA/TamA family outer membrane protein [Omnitrophica bacterium]|nr:BamA/TamA family outer membrane protein [Candidatus Omnitrophota bacterium]
MKIFNRLFIISTLIMLLSLFNLSFAEAQIPTGQDVGTLERTIEEDKAKEAARERLEKAKEEPEIEEEGVLPEEPAEKVRPEAKVLIDRVVVSGATALSQSQIRSIVAPYEGRELSLDDFREIADLITSEYRKKGYVTSLAYLPPQRIENNTLEITVAEGKVGNVNISGNKHFTKDLFLKYVDMKKGSLFNYDALRESVKFINEHPDRSTAAVLARGEGPSETDINIDVKDRMPLHAILGYNNYNSRYVNRNKYLMEFKANNFLGLDHRASAEIQLGQRNRFQLYSARYLMPINTRLKLGAYYIHVNQKLGKEVRHFDIKGEGDIMSYFASYRLYDTDNFTMHINPGFEWKDLENKMQGVRMSKDKLRIAKLGFDFDIKDPFYGRSIITHEFDWGIENLLGGLDNEDPRASRPGTGGEFFRTVTNVARIQALPASMTLMLRGAMQLTSRSIVASEQFSIGGMYKVRGYPVAEDSGDRGYTFTTELYIPPYPIPKDFKIPYTKTTLYDSLRFLAFFDWGHVDNENARVGERDHRTLMSFGPALRFEIPEKGSVSFDYGFCLGKDGSDGKDSRAYIEVKMYL